MAELIRVRAHIDGIVQGVGFRPFVHTLATELCLSGKVGNDHHGVFLEAEGEPAVVEEFLARLQLDHPPLALIDQVRVTSLPVRGGIGFVIAPSRALATGTSRALVPPDVATCADCLRELADPGDPRFGHPFISCTNCGPRYTIIVDVPYDRPQTTMAEFAMCRRCRREYQDPAARRFHAQPVCCPQCGPRLSLVDSSDSSLPGEPIASAVALLRAGRVVAVKGLGGYHLAVDATSEPAVAALRERKHRDGKPFAVLVADLPAARAVCRLSPADEQLLTDPARPIVLAPRRAGAAVAVAAGVAPEPGRLGVVLPYTPLHHLLAQRLAGPAVLTSGNLAGEPLAHRDDDALRRLAPLADAFLRHDRPIHMRADDSVACTVRGRPLLLRRSRGYVPQPIVLPEPLARPVLGCGAERNSTVCLGAGRRAFLSHHIGDLADYPTRQAYGEAIDHLQRLLGVEPLVLAHDLHPKYLSTKYARARERVELVGVQHHHAHLAACLVDNRERGPVIGVAFDGLGYGPDGTLWGGELLVADLAGFHRAGHLVPVPMPGGVSAIRQPWRLAVAHLDAAFGGEPPEGQPLLRRHAGQWRQVQQLAQRGGVAAPLTSSAGRLFDAVAAVLGVRDEVSYEGQAAMELEALVDPGERGGYPASVATPSGAPLQLAGAELVRAAASDLAGGVPVPVIAARFHNGLARLVVAACQLIRERSGLCTVALSGDVFQNLRLLTAVVGGLAEVGFRVLTHSRVPPNDGGISLGQVAVAAARQRPPALTRAAELAAEATAP